MKVCVFAALFFSCATQTVTRTKPWVDTSAIPVMSTELGFGHGCPVSEHLMLTAKHFVARRTVDGSGFFFMPRWSDGYNNRGVLEYVRNVSSADMTVLRSVAPLDRWFHIAKKAPRVGSEVLLVGYNFETLALYRTIVVAKITAVKAGHLIFDDTPGPGSSGSCVLNRAGEVVGINVSGGETEKGTMGFAVSVWGPWSPIEEEE